MIVIYQSSDNKKEVAAEANRNNARPISSRGFDIPQKKSEASVVHPSTQIQHHQIKTHDAEKEDPILNTYITRFLNSFEEALKPRGANFSGNVNVSDVLGGLARFYEKIRTTVEYKGEHLLRRNAIERILRRLIWEKDKLKPNSDQGKISTSLVKELIWAKYIPNNEISTGKVEDVKKTIEKYLDILEGLDNFPEKVTPAKSRSWIMGVASSEIEDILDPSHRDLFVNLMFDWLSRHSSWEDNNLADHEKQTQLFLAIHRSFTKSDDPTMRYYLLLREIPEWSQDIVESRKRFVMEFPKIYEEIEARLSYKGKLSIYRKISKQSAVFEILRQVVLKNKDKAKAILENEKQLEEEIKTVCESNYKQISKRVNTGIVRSIVYIFLTKVFLALLMEVPYEVFRYGDIKYIPLTINIVFPSIMMFLIGISIRIPGVKNTELISQRIKSVVYKAHDTDQKFNFDTGSVGAFTKVFGIIYIILFLAVFGGISSLLFKIGYSFIGVMVFFFFLSLVLLFAYRVRYHAQSLKVETEKEGILGHLFSYLMLPFLNLGFFLSRGLAQINVFTVLLDLLIEAPLKSMIELFEEWIGFIREKRQVIIEVPE